MTEAPATFQCPKCAGTKFSTRHEPTGAVGGQPFQDRPAKDEDILAAAQVRCTSCHTEWHPEDLAGERLEFLRGQLHPSKE